MRNIVIAAALAAGIAACNKPKEYLMPKYEVTVSYSPKGFFKKYSILVLIPLEEGAPIDIPLNGLEDAHALMAVQVRRFTFKECDEKTKTILGHPFYVNITGYDYKVDLCNYEDTKMRIVQGKEKYVYPPLVRTGPIAYKGTGYDTLFITAIYLTKKGAAYMMLNPGSIPNGIPKF